MSLKSNLISFNEEKKKDRTPSEELSDSNEQTYATSTLDEAPLRKLSWKKGYGENRRKKGHNTTKWKEKQREKEDASV